MKPKTYTQSKRPLDKIQGPKFCQSDVKQTQFQNLEKKGSDFLFKSQGHFNFVYILSANTIFGFHVHHY